MTPKELRAKKDKDLHAFLEKWRQELVGLNVQAAIGQCAKPARIKLLRRDIARVKTILNERESDAGREAE